MTFDDDVLDRLAPARAWVPDWPDVLERAGARGPHRVVTTRRLVLALAVLAAVLVPLAALGAANDWWFLRFGGAPAPTAAPQVVLEGEWDGRAWQLFAYPSEAHKLCYSMIPRGSAHEDTALALSCTPFAGVTRSPTSEAAPKVTIAFLAGGGSDQLPAYIVGPVIQEATEVEMRLMDGGVMRVRTAVGPDPLEQIRFYAAPLPGDVPLTPEAADRMLPTSIAGLDAEGNVVACLAPRTAKDGTSPLSDCR